MTECAHDFEKPITGHGCRGATRVCRCGLSERFHDYMVERARGPLVERLRAALEEYLYETTHLATPITVGGREYRKTLIPYSSVRAAREALKEPS